MSDVHPSATITPTHQAGECSADDCEASELLALVEPDDADERRVLCPTHRVEWLREVADR